MVDILTELRKACLLRFISFRTKVSFENWLKSNKLSIELVVSRSVCVMLNVVIQAKRQVGHSCSIWPLGKAISFKILIAVVSGINAHLGFKLPELLGVFESYRQFQLIFFFTKY